MFLLLCTLLLLLVRSCCLHVQVGLSTSTLQPLMLLLLQGQLLPLLQWQRHI
jgi:hypothetical protein